MSPRPQRRRCAECKTGPTLIESMTHIGGGRYICSECAADTVKAQNERAVLAACQRQVDAGDAEWEGVAPTSEELGLADAVAEAAEDATPSPLCTRCGHSIDVHEMTPSAPCRECLCDWFSDDPRDTPAAPSADRLAAERLEAFERVRRQRKWDVAECGAVRIDETGRTLACTLPLGHTLAHHTSEPEGVSWADPPEDPADTPPPAAPQEPAAAPEGPDQPEAPASPPGGSQAPQDQSSAGAPPGDPLGALAERAGMVAASQLPAPTTQPSFDLDLGDPDEILARRHDLPDEPYTGWPLRRGRVSASALATFCRCPEQFRRRYIEGLRDPGGASAITGSSAHKAIEAAARYRIEGQTIPRRVWEQWFDAKFDREVQMNGGADETDWGSTGRGEKREDLTAGTWRSRGLAAADHYISTILPRSPIQRVEQVFTTHVHGCPVPVVGIIDEVDDDALVDWKFSSRVKSAIDPEWRVQGLMYLRSGYERKMSWHSVGWPKVDGTCSYNTPATVGDGLVMAYTATNHKIGGDLIRDLVRAILVFSETFGPAGPWPGHGLTHTWACGKCYFQSNGCPWWQPKLDLL